MCLCETPCLHRTSFGEGVYSITGHPSGKKDSAILHIDYIQSQREEGRNGNTVTDTVHEQNQRGGINGTCENYINYEIQKREALLYYCSHI